MFRITTEPIRPQDLFEAVRRDSDGAVATFCGVARNNTGGRPTSYLVYDAYPPMAERMMACIVEEIRARWPEARAAILHRIGRLEIGEISVLIAVSSPHRAEAFAGCLYAIDRLKEIVPIWKKEVFEDGEEWVEGGRE